LASKAVQGLIVVDDRSVGCGTTGVPAVGMPVLSIRRMTLGSGHRYLMESVAAGDGVRHQSQTLADYYAASGTPPGVFLGGGLAGLDGGAGVEIGSEVSEEHLINLLGMCADPSTGQPLGRPPIRSSAANRTPVAGFDLTFSPSKSISAAWALAEADTKAVISACHRRAIEVVLAYAEKGVFHSRSGKNGVVQEDVEGVVATAFTHFDSIPPQALSGRVETTTRN
jgi:hypothetical protein